MARPTRRRLNPIYAVMGRAVTDLMRSGLSSDDPADLDHLEWLASGLRNCSAEAAGYIDSSDLLIDPLSHPTHAMNPIDRRSDEWDERKPPPELHYFRCMFCGAFDLTARSKRPCPWGAP